MKAREFYVPDRLNQNLSTTSAKSLTMLGRRFQAISSAIAVGIALLLVPTYALAIGVGEPFLILTVLPRLQLVPAGGSITFKLNATPGEGFGGPVNLTVVNPPSYITAKFKDNPMGLVPYHNNSTDLIIQVARDAPGGLINLTIMGKGIAYTPQSAETYALLYIAGPLQSKTTTLTITSTTTVTTTSIQPTTVTTTSTVTEQVAPLESWGYVVLVVGISVASIAVALVRVKRR